MIILGICLLLLAVLIPELAVLWTIGIICVIVGLVMFVASSMGHAIGGRRHYY